MIPGAVSPIEPQPERPPKRLALCIGIDGYAPASRYPRLRFAGADAKALGRAFSALGYETKVMADDAASEDLRPTGENLRRQLRSVTAEAGNADDTLVVTFAGHGDAVNGQLGLIPLDYVPGGSALTLDELFVALEKNAACRARNKLLVIDACRSSAEDAGRRLANGFLQDLAAARNFLVISACAADQSSSEDPALGHGRFTAALLWGLAGRAFADAQSDSTTGGPTSGPAARGTPEAEPEGEAFPAGEEFLSGAELFEYVARTFRDRKWAATQSPRMFGQIDARAALTLARRDVAAPPPLTAEDREEVAAVLAKAGAALDRMNYAEAIRRCTTALRIQEGSADASALQALGYWYMGYRDEAKKAAGLALRRDGRQALALEVRGLCELEKDRDVARKHLEDAAALADADPQRWEALRRGRAACSLWDALGVAADPVAALRYYDLAVAVPGAGSDQVAKALVSRALTYGQLRQPQFELEDLGRVIDMKDAPVEQATRAVIARGVVRGQMGQWQDGVSDLNRAIETKEASAQRA